MKRTVTVICLIIVICFCFSGCKSTDYKEAIALQNSGDYHAALEIFNTLGEYKDVSDRIKFCNTKIEKIEAYNAAVELFNSAKSVFTEKNKELDSTITEASKLVNSDAPALNEELRPSLETVVSEAKAAKKEIPSMPEETDAINALVPEMNNLDYTDVLRNIAEAQAALQTSIDQYALVNAPEEGYIIKCLEKVPGITGISAATEDNDPNGKLNKAGGYTAQVYFSYELVNQKSVSGSTIIEKGTDCGGSIEVYANTTDVEKRDIYLGAFDGTIFSSGSHKIIGTVLVRTSDKLTASQQKELEANIISVLTTIEE